MPSRPSSDRLSESLGLQVNELIEGHSCLICHEILDAPVRLRCLHVFCSLCIRRHLSRTSTCPYPTCDEKCTTSDLVSLRNYDATLQKLRVMQRAPVPCPKQAQCSTLPLPGKLSRPTLVKKLSSLGLATSGSSEALQNRYREFVLRFNAASDSAFGAPKQKVLDEVRRHETALSEPQKVWNGFSERLRNENVAQQGDTFEDLVRKIKRRKVLPKPATASQEILQRSEKESDMPAEGLQKCVGREENRAVKQRPHPLPRTSNPLKRPRSATAQSDSDQKTVDASIQNPSTAPAFSQVALKSSGVNIHQGKDSPSQRPSSEQKLTQVTPHSESNINLTEEQMERIRRNKTAAMERRRQNSQRYVRRLPFTEPQGAP
ncbi:E3 ubiquitin-protein ligase Rad18 [Gracilaria domingensis]|nr:E3 ubiquitin-protein ligase Rad18 [Gracilaria domingensis]